MAKSWLITGGSSGLGLSLGRAVLEKGSMAVLTTRSIAKAQHAAPDIKKKGGKWVQLEFSDENLEETVRDAVKRWDVDVIVNNAGYAVVGPVENISAARIRTQYEVNLFGPLRIIQAVIPIFRERKGGTIVNIGSSVSYSGMPATCVYASTKSALRTVTEGLTAELAAFGIRAILVEPGRFRTNFGANGVIPSPGAGYDEAYRGTPVEQILTLLQTMGPAPGNPDAAALRIHEVVTETGMAADDNAKGGTRFPLGSDAHASAVANGGQWSDLAKKTEAISISTDFAS